MNNLYAYGAASSLEHGIATTGFRSKKDPKERGYVSKVPFSSEIVHHFATEGVGVTTIRRQGKLMQPLIISSGYRVPSRHENV